MFRAFCDVCGKELGKEDLEIHMQIIFRNKQGQVSTNHMVCKECHKYFFGMFVTEENDFDFEEMRKKIDDNADALRRRARQNEIYDEMCRRYGVKNGKRI